MATGNTMPMASMTTIGSINFHHVPDYFAPSLLAALLIHAIGFGVILIDILSNFSFDVRLIRSQGWRVPLKVMNRLAYFLMRACTIMYLGMVMYLIVVPGIRCSSFYSGSFAMWYISLACMDFIFVSRALALYGWTKALSIPIMLLYVSYTGIGISMATSFGYSEPIPGSTFCRVISNDPKDPPIRYLLIIYYALSCSCDALVLFLTIFRLSRLPQTASVSLNTMEHGKGGAKPKSKTNVLSQTLIVQGLIFYGSFLAIKVIFIIVHYKTDYRQSWLSACFGLAATVDTTTASMLIRQTSDVVRRTQNRPPSQQLHHSNGSHTVRWSTRGTTVQGDVPPQEEGVRVTTDTKIDVGLEKGQRSSLSAFELGLAPQLDRI